DLLRLAYHRRVDWAGGGPTTQGTAPFRQPDKPSQPTSNSRRSMGELTLSAPEPGRDFRLELRDLKRVTDQHPVFAQEKRFWQSLNAVLCDHGAVETPWLVNVYARGQSARQKGPSHGWVGIQIDVDDLQVARLVAVRESFENLEVLRGLGRRTRPEVH